MELKGGREDVFNFIILHILPLVYPALDISSFCRYYEYCEM